MLPTKDIVATDISYPVNALRLKNTIHIKERDIIRKREHRADGMVWLAQKGGASRAAGQVPGEQG